MDPSVVLQLSLAEAGAASIARWLGRHSADLRARGITVTTDRTDDRDTDADRGAHADARAVDALARSTRRAGRGEGAAVVSSQAAAILLAQGDPALLDVLEPLAASVPVRVVLYLRPQHECLESAWCRLGFRTGADPSGWLRSRVDLFDHAATVRRLAERAPSVVIEAVPTTPGHLSGGNVAADFVERGLGWSPAPDDAIDRPGDQALPLELANLLRERGPLDPESFRRLVRFARGWEVPESPAVARSRTALRAFAAARYGAGNRELAARFGWADDPLGGGSDADAGLAEGAAGRDPLAELDELWRAESGPVERDLILRAVDGLLELAAAREAASRASQPATSRLRRIASRGRRALRR